MQIIIEPDGTARCIYRKKSTWQRSAAPTITRASHVEPDQQGRWLADMSPVGGAVLGPFDSSQRGPGGRARLAGDPLATDATATSTSGTTSQPA